MASEDSETASIEGYAFLVARREFNHGRGSRGPWQSVRTTKDMPTLVALLESRCG